MHDRIYIEAEELFDFVFTTGGQPANMGDYTEKFYLEDGELQREEKEHDRMLEAKEEYDT